MPSFEQSFVIIPAYNEERQIADIIDAAQSADSSIVATEQIVVIDNNSTDATSEIAIAMGAKVITCEEQGKGWAMLAGANFALELGASALTFLDADLIGLKPEHIDKLVAPVLDEQAAMTIGYLGGRKPILKLLLEQWGGFSGQRTVSLDVWDQLRSPDFTGCRIEGALNAVCRNMGIGDEIERIELEDLRHIGKRCKESNIVKASIKYAQTYSSATRGLLSISGTNPDII